MRNRSSAYVILANRIGCTHEEARQIYDQLARALLHTLRSEGRAVLPGVGIFRARHMPMRVGRNPRTGERITVPERLKVAFDVNADFLEKAEAK